MRLLCIPQTVSNRLAPYRSSFRSSQTQHFRIWCWLLVTLVISGSGRIKDLTRLMPSSLAYWATLRMIRAKVWDESDAIAVSGALRNLQALFLRHFIPYFDLLSLAQEKRADDERDPRHDQRKPKTRVDVTGGGDC